MDDHLSPKDSHEESGPVVAEGQVRHAVGRVVRLIGDPGARSGTLALADQLVASATNFLTGVIIGRFCSQDEFGLYMLGLSVVFLAMRLQMALILTPYMVFSPQLDPDDRVQYLGSSLIHQFCVSCVTIFGLGVGAVILSTGIGPPGLDGVVWALILAVAFILLRDYVRNICFSHLDFRTALILDASISVVQIGGLFYLASRNLLSARLAFFVIGSACAVAVSPWLARRWRMLRIQPARVIADFRRNWNFGRWIFASGLLWEASLSLYPWILTFFHGSAETGVWAACFGVVAVSNPVLLGMQNYLGPKIAHAYVGDGRASFRRHVYGSAALFTLLVLPISAVLIGLGNWLVTLLYGDKYDGHGIVITILALGLLVGPVRFALSRALFAMDKAMLEFVTNAVPLLILIALGIWLVRTFSVVGVASGILIGDILVTVAKYGVFEAQLKAAGRSDPT